MTTEAFDTPAFHALGWLHRHVRDELVPGARELRLGERPDGQFHVAVVGPDGEAFSREWDHAPNGEEIMAALHSIAGEANGG